MDNEKRDVAAPPPGPGGPNDTTQHGEEDPAAFFGDGAGEPEEGGNGVLTEEKPDGDEPDAAGEPDPSAIDAAGDRESTDDPEPAPEPEPAAAAPADGAGKSGAVTRDYKIFVERRLSEALLKKLLEQVKNGSDGNVPIVYLELGEVNSRNPEGALRAGFKRFRSELGDEATLAPTPARSWNPQSVKPRPKDPDEEDIQIG